MSLSIYVHIPYCIQRCRYCDFTTFEQNSIMPPDQYLNLLLAELRNREQGLSLRHLRSIYFGGGTPSLVPAEHIVTILREVANSGFLLDESTEITLEINPATLTKESLEIYLSAGVNRFSVGAQTFNDSLLRLCGREHNAQQTRETLYLLEKYQLNYSFDLLFALPGQSLEMVSQDLRELFHFHPNHLSAYCLTVPQGHPMSSGRAPEDEQVEMFQLIESQLHSHSLEKYEISNFAHPGFESQHNLCYWQNESYWGLGLSAHSYLNTPGYGTRFWNPKSFDLYKKQIEILSPSAPYSSLPSDQKEELLAHESLTDFCHMHLRLRRGLQEAPLQKWFSTTILSHLWPRLDKLVTAGLLVKTLGGWALSTNGEMVSNRVFAELTFSSNELN
ncbi:MAG: radical SAM family heme chaperone HemW [Bdellovibrionales bacterium]|nr:radical SAM family heme chaperone HemW [Bdellovibrionales bacterium]